MKGKRTIIISAIIIVLGVAQQLVDGGIIPQSASGIVLTIVGAITAVLRYFTTTPVGKS